MSLSNNDIVAIDWYRTLIVNGTVEQGQRLAVEMYDKANELKAENKKLKDTDKMWKFIFDIRVDSPGYMDYVKEWRKKTGHSDLSYPDGYAVYRDYAELKAENKALKERLEKAEMSFTLAVGTMRYNFAGHTLIKEGYKEMIDAIIEINRIGDEEIYEFFEKEAEARLKELKGEK